MRTGAMASLILGFVEHSELTPMSHDGTRKKGTWSMARWVPALVCVLIAGFTFGAGGARAAVIGAGFDLFATNPVGTFVNINGTPIPLQGVPFIVGTNTDTVVERIGPNIPDGGTGSFQIRLDALFLKSQMTNNYAGIGLADLYATRNFMSFGIPQPDVLPSAPLGTLTVLTNTANTGTISSSLPVIVDLIFTKPGGNPNNPSDILHSQIYDSSPTGLNDPFLGSGNWFQAPPPNDAHPLAPAPLNQSGGFFAMMQTEAARLAAHPPFLATANVPEPSALILSGTGALLCLGYLARRKRPAT